MIESQSMATPARNPELNRVQEESDTALKTLIETTAQLSSRLSRVMGPPTPTTDSEKGETKYHSKLAQDIESHNNGIWSTIRSLRLLMDRLEI